MKVERILKFLSGFILIILIIAPLYSENKVLSNNRFVQKDISKLNAEIVTNTIPTNVQYGKKYDFSVTVKNTGSETWSESDSIRLCIWQNMQDWGYRAYLPEDVIVMPNEEYTFYWYDFCLEEEKTILELQMAYEGVTYFGEKEPVEINIDK